MRELLTFGGKATLGVMGDPSYLLLEGSVRDKPVVCPLLGKLNRESGGA